MAKQTTKQKAEKKRKPLQAGLPVRDMLATHHVKLFSTDTAWSQRIVDVASLAGKGDPKDGVCSTTIDSRYALTMTGGGGDIVPVQTTALDLGYGHRGNALHYAMMADRTSLAEMEFSDREIDLLVAGTSEIAPVVPSSIDATQKQVFFETDGDCILVTPCVSAKALSEITARVNDAWSAWKDAGRPTNRQDTVPAALNARFGGARPHNAGSSIASPSRNSIYSAIPFLVAKPPQDQRTPAEMTLARIGARGTYDAAVSLDDADLKAFAARAKTGIQLRTHIDAEAIHADELVAAYLAPADIVKPIVASRDRLGTRAPYDKLSRSELAFLDRRNGTFDPDLLSRIFAKNMSRQIGWAAKRSGAAGSGPYMLPARSFDSLVTAFQKALAR